jgi:hypothetical protein
MEKGIAIYTKMSRHKKKEPLGFIIIVVMIVTGLLLGVCVPMLIEV